MTTNKPTELRYGNNVQSLLTELASYDAADIDGDEFEVYGEDRNGREGSATISITELAADAAKLLAAQEAELQEYRRAQEPIGFIEPDEVELLKGGEGIRVWPDSIATSKDIPVYLSSQPLTDAERAELQEYRKAQAVPAGWVAVPVEMSAAMSNAMTDAISAELCNAEIWSSVLGEVSKQGESDGR